MSMNVLPDTFFRTLSPPEEAEFRLWAHNNPEATNTIDPTIIHPVIRDEWAQIARSMRGGGK